MQTFAPKTYTRMFMVALLIGAHQKKSFRNTIINEHIHRLEYYLGMKVIKLILHTAWSAINIIIAIFKVENKSSLF